MESPEKEKKKKNGFLSFKSKSKKNKNRSNSEEKTSTDHHSESNNNHAIELSSVLKRLNSLEKQLENRQVDLEARISHEQKAADKHRNGNQQLFNRAMQRRKLYEKQLSVVDGTLTTLEVQRQALDSAQLSVEVNELSEKSGDALQLAQKRVDIDKVQSVIDAIEEEKARIAQLNDAMASPKMASNHLEDNELLRELEQLETEERRREDEHRIAMQKQQQQQQQYRPIQPRPPPQMYPQIVDDRPIYSGGRIMGDRVAANRGIVTVQVGANPNGSVNGYRDNREREYDRRGGEDFRPYRGPIYDEPYEDRVHAYYYADAGGASQHAQRVQQQQQQQQQDEAEMRSFAAMRRPYRGGNELLYGYGGYRTPDAPRAFIANEQNRRRDFESGGYYRDNGRPSGGGSESGRNSHRARSVPRMVIIDGDHHRNPSSAYGGAYEMRTARHQPTALY